VVNRRLNSDSDELFYLVRNLFKQLLLATVQEAQDEMPGASFLQNLEGEELRDAVNQIILAEPKYGAENRQSGKKKFKSNCGGILHDAGHRRHHVFEKIIVRATNV